MTPKINLHTHCNFCDGKNTPEEMVLAAIEKGFSVLGFSSHSMTPFQSDWHMKPEDHQIYKNTILNLKKKYEDKITIHWGFETDYVQNSSIPEKSRYKELEPEYLIGSVHYLGTLDQDYAVDDSTENVKEGLNRIYKNDGKQLVCDYFECERQMLKSGKFEIWGHPDLVRKRNPILKFFNEEESWYKEQVQLTVKAAAHTSVVAEINTGAIARGCMDDVYPSAYMLDLLYKAGIPVCVNSDAHSTDHLDCAFDRAYEIAKKIGYKELVYPVAGKEYIIKL